MAKIKYTLELVELKYKEMKKRIQSLKNSFANYPDENTDKSDMKDLEVVETQYDKMYQAMLQEKSYDKYEEIEKIIFPYLARLDSKLDEYAYRTRENSRRNNIRNIK